MVKKLRLPTPDLRTACEQELTSPETLDIVIPHWTGSTIVRKVSKSNANSNVNIIN